MVASHPPPKGGGPAAQDAARAPKDDEEAQGKADEVRQEVWGKVGEGRADTSAAVPEEVVLLPAPASRDLGAHPIRRTPYRTGCRRRLPTCPRDPPRSVDR